MAMIVLQGVVKRFRLHLQGGLVLPVFEGLDLEVGAGECLVLRGASGAGKSTVLKLAYGNYKALGGRILVRHGEREVDLAAASAREIQEVRRHTLGYVSQFLRCVPRVAARDVVAEPLVARGMARGAARQRSEALLRRLRIPERLLDVPPATFSGGEQQRVNIARGFVAGYPILLLDEPTASLDATNRGTVIEMMLEAKARGAAMLGVFHDRDVRDAVADRQIDIEPLRTAA